MTRIFCPKCAWKPGPHDLWECEPSRGHEWHTFDTRGQCPACRKQWNQTECLRCARWSKHALWYHDDADDGARWERLVQAAELSEVEAAPAHELAPLPRR